MIYFVNTLKTLNAFGSAVISEYRQRLATNPGWDAGSLFRNASFDVQVNGSNFEIGLNLEEYWKYIESGRRPGAKQPPTPVIEEWIRYRKIVPRPMQLANGRTVLPTQKQLAFLIARKIGRDGIPPKPYLQESIAACRAEFIEKLKVAIAQDIYDGIRTGSQGLPS